MGMYTELIFGARLKENTPADVIEVLKYMLGDTDTRPESWPFGEGRHSSLFRCSSYYFGVSNHLSKMWFDDICDAFIISTRASLKNYNNEIEDFLKWIRPYIDSGSGVRNMYAIVTYEESEEPVIYYLEDKQ